MRIFILIATKNASEVAASLHEKNLINYSLKDDSWLVAFDGTTRQLAESLGIRQGETGSGIVCRIDGYSGRLPKEAWEWLGAYEAESA